MASVTKTFQILLQTFLRIKIAITSTLHLLRPSGAVFQAVKVCHRQIDASER